MSNVNIDVDLEEVLDSLKGPAIESRIKLIDTLIMFSEFADKLNTKLVLRFKNLVFRFNICTVEKFKIRSTDTDLNAKVWPIVHFCHL